MSYKAVTKMFSHGENEVALSADFEIESGMRMSEREPCAWCGADTMDWNASFNGKDICNDCADEAEESE